MSEVEEIKTKINTFLDKKGLNVKDKYGVIKSLQDDYWDEWNSNEEEEDDELDEFEEDDLPEEEEEEDLTEVPNTSRKGIKSIVKKPKSGIKKPNVGGSL